MEYDENLFKAKANRRARNIWLVFSLLLTANYGADVANDLLSDVLTSLLGAIFIRSDPYESKGCRH